MRTSSLLLLLAGFAALTPGRGHAQAAETVPCSVPVASSGQESWQQIAARGFTFCIPGSWRAVRNNTFRGDGGWVRWGTGQHRGREVGTVVVTVPAEDVSRMTPSLPGRFNHFPETIGGFVAELSDSEVEGRFYTGAQWQTPERVYLEGESTDARVRTLQLEIYRTVRFTQQ